MSCCQMKSSLVMVLWHFIFLTKFLCVCHKCNGCALDSIKSKCDLSKIVNFGEHTMTCKSMIWDFVGHVLVHHSFEHVFDGRNITPSHQVMCTTTWLKRQPTTLIWSILHGLGHYHGHQNHRHINIYKTHLW